MKPFEHICTHADALALLTRGAHEWIVTAHPHPSDAELVVLRFVRDIA